MMNNPMVQELMGKNPIPIPVQWVMAFTGLAVSMISGGFMLQGKSWARLLYVIWSVCGLLISLATSPAKLTLIPGLLLYGVIVFFLFRPKANEFFAAPPTSNGS
jgi:hypothetical protein